MCRADLREQKQGKKKRGEGLALQDCCKKRILSKWQHISSLILLKSGLTYNIGGPMTRQMIRHNKGGMRVACD